MKKLRIGMVGAGNIANVHLNAYQTLDNVEIAAICDINAERLNETADLFNIEKRYATEAEMLANEQLDAADVCVWNCN
ncbi:MAG: Gfo/Idh/MocA family protein, partial [Eubacteriales bacterium]